MGTDSLELLPCFWNCPRPQDLVAREHSQARNMGDVVEVEETIPKRQTFKVVVGTGTEDAVYFCFGGWGGGCFAIFVLFFEAGFHVAQAGLKLTMQLT